MYGYQSNTLRCAIRPHRHHYALHVLTLLLLRPTCAPACFRVSPALSPLLLSHSLQTGTTRTTYHPPRTTHYSHSLVLGKVEGKGDNWHGHVTAVTIAPEYRRLGLAKRLMDSLEHVSENM